MGIHGKRRSYSSSTCYTPLTRSALVDVTSRIRTGEFRDMLAVTTASTGPIASGNRTMLVWKLATGKAKLAGWTEGPLTFPRLF